MSFFCFAFRKIKTINVLHQTLKSLQFHIIIVTMPTNELLNINRSMVIILGTNHYFSGFGVGVLGSFMRHGNFFPPFGYA